MEKETDLDSITTRFLLDQIENKQRIVKRGDGRGMIMRSERESLPRHMDDNRKVRQPVGGRLIQCLRYPVAGMRVKPKKSRRKGG